MAHDANAHVDTAAADSGILASYQKESEKGVASGYASLDSGGKVPDSEIPSAIARDSELHVENHGAAEHTGIGAALSVLATSDTSEALGIGYVDATGLSFSIAASKTYHFDFFIRWESAATTTGINLAMNGPASPTAVAFVAFSAFNPTTYSPRPMTAYDTSSSGTGAQATGTALFAEIKGIVVNGSNAGTLQVRFQTEIPTSAVTIKAGSGGRLWLMN